MRHYSKRNRNQLIAIGIIVLLVGFLSAGYWFSLSNESEIFVNAQTNNKDTAKNKDKTQDFKFANRIKNHCKYPVEYTNFPDANVIYNWTSAGFPFEVSLEEAVYLYNKFAMCHKIGKTQPELTSEEIISSIRDWDCSKEKAGTKKMCSDLWKIAETRMMPKGSIIDYDGFVKYHERGYKGFEVDTWEIRIYLYLDKYRRDLKGVPEFSRIIRLKYLSSKLRAISSYSQGS